MTWTSASRRRPLPQTACRGTVLHRINAGLRTSPPPSASGHAHPMSQTLELTRNLMARRSVTPADEGCQEIMMARLIAAGFHVEPLRYGSVENFWAKRGNGGPVLCFAGHTDVVPTGPLEEWKSDPFKPAVRDGLLFGRGAADMKSALAAMVTATEDFVK